MSSTRVIAGDQVREHGKRHQQQQRAQKDTHGLLSAAKQIKHFRKNSCLLTGKLIVYQWDGPVWRPGSAAVKPEAAVQAALAPSSKPHQRRQQHRRRRRLGNHTSHIDRSTHEAMMVMDFHLGRKDWRARVVENKTVTGPGAAVGETSNATNADPSSVPPKYHHRR